MKEWKKIERDIKRLEKIYKRQLITASFVKEYNEYRMVDVIKSELERLNRKYYNLKMQDR